MKHLTYLLFFLVRTFKFYSFTKSSHTINILLTTTVTLYLDPQMLFILLLKVYTLLTLSPYFPNPAVSGSYSFYEFDITFFQISHISDPMLHLSFSVWLISLSIMPSRFIYIVISGRIPFFLMAE